MTDSKNQHTIFERLVSLPLFIGMTHDEMNDIIAHTKLDFQKYSSGQQIIYADQPCNEIKILMTGSLKLYAEPIDHSYRMEETISTPTLLEPERLFGLMPRYANDYRSEMKCSILSITKQDVFKLLSQYEIIHFNFMNIVSTRSQTDRLRLWMPQQSNIFKRISFFLTTHCMYLSGEKKLIITMQHLARLIGESRINTSDALHTMEKSDIIILQRNVITVPSLQKLIQFSNN